MPIPKFFKTKKFIAFAVIVVLLFGDVPVARLLFLYECRTTSFDPAITDRVAIGNPPLASSGDCDLCRFIARKEFGIREIEIESRESDVRFFLSKPGMYRLWVGRVGDPACEDYVTRTLPEVKQDILRMLSRGGFSDPENACIASAPITKMTSRFALEYARGPKWLSLFGIEDRGGMRLIDLETGEVRKSSIDYWGGWFARTIIVDPFEGFRPILGVQSCRSTRRHLNREDWELAWNPFKPEQDN
jgi:hypothetical protein